MTVILVTGPARSGKSEWAEALVAQSAESVVYLATGREDPEDPEWQARIERHRQRRPSHWQTWAVPLDLIPALRRLAPPQTVLIDSLGTWVANGLELEASEWEERQGDFLGFLAETALDLVLVAEETGWGLVPPYPLGRRFRDRLGALTRRVGSAADQVYLVAGGYALNLSRWGERLPSND